MSAVPTLPAVLRDATRQLHHLLDHHVLLAPLLRADLDHLAYRAALRALHAINAPLEARLADYLAARHPAFDYAGRRRADALAADIRWLGSEPPPPAWDGPAIRNDAELAGCLYVIEGSNLGGQVIYRQVAERLGVTPEGGGRYFHGHGGRAREVWDDFWHFAATICPPDAHGEAAAAAAGLFGDYLRLLDACPGEAA